MMSCNRLRLASLASCLGSKNVLLHALTLVERTSPPLKVWTLIISDTDSGCDESFDSAFY